MIEQRGLRWCLLGTSGLFAALGLLFLFAPGGASRLFGIPTAAAGGQAFVQAVGLRDIALAGYLALLTLYASARAVLIVLAMTLVIPAGDLVVVATDPGGKPTHLLLHLASGLLFATLTLWVWAAGGRAGGSRRG